MQNNERVDYRESWWSGTEKDCVEAPLVDGAATALKFTKPSRYLYKLFHRASARMLRHPVPVS